MEPTKDEKHMGFFTIIDNIIKGKNIYIYNYIYIVVYIYIIMYICICIYIYISNLYVIIDPT